MEREFCDRCQCCDVDWEECWNCGGDGEFDEHEIDPLNCDPGEFFTDCDICRGNGGYWMCIGRCDAAGRHQP